MLEPGHVTDKDIDRFPSTAPRLNAGTFKTLSVPAPGVASPSGVMMKEQAVEGLEEDEGEEFVGAQ